MEICLSIDWVCSFHQILKGMCELKQFVSKFPIHYLGVFIWLILKLELSPEMVPWSLCVGNRIESPGFSEGCGQEKGKE